MKLIIMIFTTLFALSCVYNPPFKEIETIKTEKNLLSWICDEGIEIKLDTSSDEGPYLLALKNVFSIDTQNYENNNIGEWQKSEASTDTSSPAKCEVINHPSDTNNKVLTVELKREPNVEFIYIPITIPKDFMSYVFRYDYWNISKNPSALYMSIVNEDFTAHISKKEYSTMQNSQEGTAVNTFEFTNKGNYNLCFGVPDPEEQTPTFAFYLDNVYFFPNSNHALEYPVKIKQEGIYKLLIKAKKDTTNTLTLKIAGYAGSFELTDDFKEYGYYIRLPKGNNLIEIMPVSQELHNRVPGSIKIMPPKLEYHPFKKDIK